MRSLERHISGIEMARSLVFAHFKSTQGLSYRDICTLFCCSMKEAKDWERGNAPDEVNQIALIVNEIQERLKIADMSDIDRQLFEHRSEKLTNENEALKGEVAELKRRLAGYELWAREGEIGTLGDTKRLNIIGVDYGRQDGQESNVEVHEDSDKEKSGDKEVNEEIHQAQPLLTIAQGSAPQALFGPHDVRFDELWSEFSEIQCASWLIIDRESVSRFKDWMKSGDPDDAWS